MEEEDLSSSFSVQRKKKNKNTKRFSDEQIRSLESIFKLDTKLEPKKKIQLARELELQPRQVAIWFQNRRARWKSKQLEQEYRALKTNYDNLNSQFEFLKEEKESLLAQLQKLNEMLKEIHSTNEASKGLEERSTNQGLDDENNNSEIKADTKTLTDTVDNCSIMHSDPDERENTGGLLDQYQGAELLSFCQQLDGPLPPAERWCNFGSGDISDQACGNSNWWEF
ncbi:hypothetical protein DCAR_0626054 [Daucus carota subsp. sativus]|uniref:Homeobox-leucine zipper protein n=1 Tax=Daucus carota subsp. sativus TaxID=79200 RepID=A0A161ZYH0_DAUCS|nr:PREDICTED: homeobox-leucine zipper protein ATHB-12-like [Daucus carota subsp. sativus]WOH06626.1 hypothetical protein DCAR_0626054 [Daucus carota subsp. sativus]